MVKIIVQHIKKKNNLTLIKDDNGEFIHNKELYADPNTLPGGMANVSYICIYKHTHTRTYLFSFIM